MISVYIIVGILLLLLLLLLIPISADMGYRDKFEISVRYGGIKVFDSTRPKKQKPPAPKKEVKAPETIRKPLKKESFIDKIFRERGKIEGIKFCFSLIKAAFSRIIWLIKKIKFKRLILNISVASSEAANTAITYGALCGTVYPIINLIDQNSCIGVKKVNIYTNFDKLSPEIETLISAESRLIYAVISAISLLFAYLRLKKESDKNERK